MLQTLLQYGVEDLQVAVRAAEANRRTREGEGFFLQHFFQENRTVSLEEAGDGSTSTKVSIPVSPLVMNPAGMVHGGVTALLCDNAMGMASYLHAQKPGLTVEMTVRYHKPGRGATLTAQGQVVFGGSRLNSTRCEVRDDFGGLVASATGTFYHHRSTSN